MAAHQHHHRHHHHQNPPSTCCSLSFSHGCSLNCKPNCNSNCNQAFHCPSPPLHSIDPILESLASHQLYTQNHCFHGLQNPNNRLQPQQQPNQRSTDLLISTLVSRIEALEASLSHFPPNRSREASVYGFYSLREVAARVIQTHFRAFLVRRSRTLGQLKDLAIVKSSFSSLRSSICNESHVDLYSVSRKAVDLLVKLDSIQSDDSMVRDGKRSISRDLVRFLDFIEGVSVRRHKLYLEAMKKKKKKNNVGFGQNGVKHRAFVNRNCSDSDLDRREIIRNLKERVEKIRGYTKYSLNDDEDVVLEGFQHVTDEDESEEIEEENPVVVIREKCNPIINGVFAKKKSVSFAENRNVLKLFSNADESVSNELDGDSTTSSEDDQIQSREVEEIEASSRGTEGANIGPKGLPRGIRSGPRREGDYEIRGCYEGEDGEFLFSAPLPVQMEEKTDLLKKMNMG